jgi:hypothetical protein
MRLSKLFAACCAVVIFSAALPGANSGVTFKKDTDRIDVLIDGKPFTSYYFSSSLPRPFFHPLRTADGKIVTRGYPMITDIPGEAKDHPHHRSSWFTFGDVDGVDYWGEASKKPGKIVHRSIDRMDGGQKGTLAVTMDWVDDNGRKVLTQKEEVVFRGDSSRRSMDFTIALTPVNGAVTFRDTKEGMFAVRLITTLEEKSGGLITNSRGGVGEKNTWGKKAEWVDYTGQIEGTPGGVTMMDHPSSFRHPTTWHVRAYGLFAANPFGLRDFTGDKNQDGSFKLEPGKNLTFRYRILIHPGDTASAKIPEEYQRYLREVK